MGDIGAILGGFQAAVGRVSGPTALQFCTWHNNKYAYRCWGKQFSRRNDVVTSLSHNCILGGF